MSELLTFLNQNCKKQFKSKILNKIFKKIKVCTLFYFMFNDDNDDNEYLSLLDIIKTLIEKIFIQNNGKIKLDKQLFELIDKYNNISTKNEILNTKKDDNDTDTDDDTTVM